MPDNSPGSENVPMGIISIGVAIFIRTVEPENTCGRCSRTRVILYLSLIHICPREFDHGLLWALLQLCRGQELLRDGQGAVSRNSLLYREQFDTGSDQQGRPSSD